MVCVASGMKLILSRMETVIPEKMHVTVMEQWEVDEVHNTVEEVAAV